MGDFTPLRWAAYDVDLGATVRRRVQFRVASGAASGVSGLLGLRLDSPTGQLLGQISVAGTGGWQQWRSVPGDIAALSGRHRVYLTFTSGQPADFVNVNWFAFE